MKNYNIDAKTTAYGAVVRVEVTDGSLSALLTKAGAATRITVTGRGNVRQIKTIAKTFYRALKGEP
ncbi:MULTISPECIES: hypothetical protein [Providencia]|uniref:hypothetical protein n=1 Tax=Providencia TaxID=586 RepID=UPI002349D2F0|nr:hypothetical protein [Providencia rettgeri]